MTTPTDTPPRGPGFRPPSAGLIFIVSLLLIAVGWGGWFARRVRARHAAIRAIRNAGGGVDARPTLPEWLRKRIDWDWADGLDHVYSCRLRHATDENLAHVATLTGLDSLDVDGRNFTDDGLRHLARLKGLRRLSLGMTPVSDEGLKHLARLPRVSILYLNGTSVSDAGLHQLEATGRLETIQAKSTRVTAEGAAGFQRRRPGCMVER